MSDIGPGFWKFATHVINKLNTHGPISVMAFASIVMLSLVAILVTDRYIVAIAATFLLLINGLVAGFTCIKLIAHSNWPGSICC